LHLLSVSGFSLFSSFITLLPEMIHLFALFTTVIIDEIKKVYKIFVKLLTTINS